MTDHIEELPIRSTPSSHRDNADSENTTATYIPISDFRRNEARPILTENGNA